MSRKICLAMLLLIIAMMPMYSVSAQDWPGVWIGPNAWSSIDVTYDEVILTVCASNLRDNQLKLVMNRGPIAGYPGRSWTLKVNKDGTLNSYRTKAWNENTYTATTGAWAENFTSSGIPCTRIHNIDGAGPTFSGVWYNTIVRYHGTPVLATDEVWDGCYNETNGRYLCDADIR